MVEPGAEDGASLFNYIISDMKMMSPLLEDFIVKAGKFYSAVKLTAVAADAFLDTFQKVADMTTNSKGATRDLGVSFTKMVMRHRSIEHKLKAYVGILMDNFIGPLQEKFDEWKRIIVLLEKDHAKDFKRLKGELKKASADATKLKKKASKKGRSEYTEQYREALKMTNSLVKSLEEQEKQYLRKLMTEERQRSAFLFSCYKPCVEQEISLVSEVEHLQSILDETVKQCQCPQQLPLISEDAIDLYKVPESWIAASRDACSASSPPSSPPIIKDRSLTVNGTCASVRSSLTRSQTLPSNSSGFGTLRKKGPDPIPVEIPTPAKSVGKTSDDGSNDTASRSSSSFDVASVSSSRSSLEQGGSAAVCNLATLQRVHSEPRPAQHLQEDVHAVQNNSSCIVSSDGAGLGLPKAAREVVNIHKALKNNTRTSWSSSEASDSSGIGSYCSLTSQNTRSAHSSVSFLSGGQPVDMIDADFIRNFDVNSDNYSPFLAAGFRQFANVAEELASELVDEQKYATIDRSHFRRNQIQTASLRSSRFVPERPSTNSRGKNEDVHEEFPDYKLNLSKFKMNTVAGRGPYVPAGGKPTVFQVFPGPGPQDLGTQLSPSSSLKKIGPPVAPKRRMSSPVGPSTTEQESRQMLFPDPPPELLAEADEGDDEVQPTAPGTFLDQLQQQRNAIKQRSLSVDHSSTHPRHR